MRVERVHDVVAVQRRTVRTLVAAQATGAVGITTAVATASLLTRDISGSETLAGLSQTTQVLGGAVAAYALARLMTRRGRRIGLLTGFVLGGVGASLAVLAGVVGSLPLLLLGTVLIGATTAANLAARYAATDLAPAETRGRALSTVVWATTIGAVAGPNLAGPAGSWALGVGLPELTGPFALGALSSAVAAVVVAVGLRPDPLLLAREVAGVADEPPAGTSWGRVVETVRARPALGAAIAGMAGAHAAMIAVMAMTPLHMEHGGAELDVIGIVISVHVLGMFAFSPLVGRLVDRWGRAEVLGSGGAVLLVSLVVCGLAPEGASVRIFVGLFLLGLGWSLATVAAATLVADHAPLAVRADVQGASDLTMGLTAASASAFAGVIVGSLGFSALAVFAGVLALAVLGAAVATRRHS